MNDLASRARRAGPHAGRRSALVLLAGAAGAAGLVVAGRVAWRARLSRQLLAAAQAHSQQPAAPTGHLLVIGDSTGVGTGSEAAADSVAGRIGQAHPDWRIDNLAVNGARVADLAGQLQRAPGTPDRVLVMVGGNDVIRLTAWDRLGADLLASVRQAQDRGAKVVLMPCGDVGQAPFFPPPWSWWLQRRSDTLHQVVDAIGRATGAAVVDLRLPAAVDPFLQQPQRYYAADGLHPNGAGYGLWFQRLQQAQVLG